MHACDYAFMPDDGNAVFTTRPVSDCAVRCDLNRLVLLYYNDVREVSSREQPPYSVHFFSVAPIVFLASNLSVYL